MAAITSSERYHICTSMGITLRKVSMFPEETYVVCIFTVTVYFRKDLNE